MFVRAEIKKLSPTERKQQTSSLDPSLLIAAEQFYGIGPIQDGAFALSEWLTLIHSVSDADLDLFWNLCGEINGIDRITAYRILGLLPTPLLDVVPFNPDIQTGRIEVEAVHWLAISSWLIYFEKEDKHILPYLQTAFPGYDAYARLSELRYQLIRGLIDTTDEIWPIFPEAGLPWLLCEVAICRQRLSGLDKHHSKKAHYKRVQVELKQIEEHISGNGMLDIQNLKDIGMQAFLTRFDSFIDLLAIQTAKANPKFDRLYMRPYLAASRSWNVATKKPEWTTQEGFKTRNRQLCNDL